VSSKTFTTLETLTNATAARDWLLAGLGAGNEAVAKHFVAVSTNEAGSLSSASTRPTCSVLGLGGWALLVRLGNRFSLMVAIGRGGFDEMLSGFHAVDQHFLTAPLERNVPVLCGY